MEEITQAKKAICQSNKNQQNSTAFCNAKRYESNGITEIGTLSSTENYLIRGDCLPVLQLLQHSFKGAIKLIYIDPPYNTGRNDLGYPDRMSHTEWLAFMKDRLQAAKKLLHPTGAIFIQIDDKEMAYLKLLCDEVFGRENSKTCITVKSSTPSGINAINVLRGERLYKVKEHLLYYAKDARLHRFNPMYVRAGSYNMNYRLQVRFADGTYTVTDVYKDMLNRMYRQDTTRGLSPEQKHSFLTSFERYCLAHPEHIYALKPEISKAGVHFKAFVEANKQKGIVEQWHTASGRSILIYKGGMLTPLKTRITEANGAKHYGTLISDLWSDMAAVPAAEGGVAFKYGKKPEKLLKRILALCTTPGDIILDFFLGSGTTSAVALKMNRRFIGIEQLDYGDNDSVRRLQNVIAGDQTGISKDGDVNWKGGGSFVYAELKKPQQ